MKFSQFVHSDDDLKGITVSIFPGEDGFVCLTNSRCHTAYIDVPGDDSIRHEDDVVSFMDKTIAILTEARNKVAKEDAT